MLILVHPTGHKGTDTLFVIGGMTAIKAVTMPCRDINGTNSDSG